MSTIEHGLTVKRGLYHDMKWLKGMLGDEKWATFIAEASEIFAISYGGILRTVTRSWAQSELGSDLSDDMEMLVAW